MQTFLYNTITQKREGPVRNGPYLVDGQPGVLPDGWVELTIYSIPAPPYDPNTQYLTMVEYVDLPTFRWIQEFYIVNMTNEQIEGLKPDSCTPRQFRLALIYSGISLSTVENLINQIPDPNQREIVRVQWEYAIMIEKNNELVQQLFFDLGYTKEQIDNIFILAVTL